MCEGVVNLCQKIDVRTVLTGVPHTSAVWFDLSRIVVFGFRLAFPTPCNKTDQEFPADSSVQRVKRRIAEIGGMILNGSYLARINATRHKGSRVDADGCNRDSTLRPSHDTFIDERIVLHLQSDGTVFSEGLAQKLPAAKSNNSNPPEFLIQYGRKVRGEGSQPPSLLVTTRHRLFGVHQYWPARFDCWSGLAVSPHALRPASVGIWVGVYRALLRLLHVRILWRSPDEFVRGWTSAVDQQRIGRDRHVWIQLVSRLAVVCRMWGRLGTWVGRD